MFFQGGGTKGRMLYKKFLSTLFASSIHKLALLSYEPLLLFLFAQMLSLLP